ncbi:MAG: glycosyltransferase family 39 protein [Patescibacteria group bacterium]|nr:glycosyltransferase family 39 protein [Patescibacteria group bacterium]
MKKFFQFFAISIILILAAFLRLYKIQDYMTFLGDEGRDVLVVYGILHGDFTLLGPTASVGGFFLGPIYYYFMAPFLWLFNYNPVGPAVMVALFGIATVFLVYKVGKEFFDKTTGIIAASLYAISPLVISYSRSSWNPNLMPFFSILLIYFLYKAVSNSSIRYFILAGLSLGIMIQLHYLTVFLVVITAVYIFLGWIVKNKKHLFSKIWELIKNYILVSIGFVIGLSPYLAFETRHGFPNTKSIIKFIFHSPEVGSSGNYFTIINDVFFRLFGRLIVNYPQPETISVKDSLINYDFYYFSFKAPVAYLYYFVLIIALSSLGLLLVKLYRERKSQKNFLKLSLIFFWLAIGVLLFGFYKKSIYDYYFGFMFPLPFLLVGSLLSFLISKKGVFRIISILIFVFLVARNLSGVPFRYLPNRQYDQVGKISKAVLDKTGGKPFNFALITKGNSDHAYRYFLKIWNHDPIVIDNFQKDPQRKTVTDQLLIVCEADPCAPLGNSLWEVAGFGRAEITGEWPVSVVKVYKLVHYKGS